MNTPLYAITYRYHNATHIVYVKDESFNITGSIKYRPARFMIDEAYKHHEINKDTTIFEVTSGNMGIALASVAKEYGNKIVIYMPRQMSEERKKMLRSLGAELILTDSFKEAFSLANQRKEGYYTRQFENVRNAMSYVSFCQEVEEKIKEFPAFIAGVGTAGTLIGVGRYLKDKYHSQIIAVEPKESLILSTGVDHGEHEIQGLSDGFIPKLYDKKIVDRVLSISSNDAIKMTQMLNEHFHLHIGISSGANFLGAVIANIEKALTVFPDSSDRYHSTRLSEKNIISNIASNVKLLHIRSF